MKVFKLDKPPKNYSWVDSDSTDELEFDEYFIKHNCDGFSPDAVFYWYASGSYEGSGDLLAVKDGKWYNKDLSHCSCYGPLEDFATNETDYQYSSLQDIKDRCTVECYENIKPLVDLAINNGYK